MSKKQDKKQPKNS